MATMNRPPTRIFAHRGARADSPENTIEAFQHALSAGANALELDVHASRDGVLVVIHDDHGRRIAGIDENVAEVSFRQIATWRVQYPDGSPSTASVPTLTDVLDQFPGIPLSVDLKVDDTAVADVLVELICDRNAQRSVTLASFHQRIMNHLHARAYPGPTALSRLEVAAVRFLPGILARRLVRGTAAQIPRASGLVRLDRAPFITRCRQLGLRVDYWVVNQPSEALSLLERGATGVMTDDPVAVAPAVHRWLNESTPTASTDQLQLSRQQGRTP